MCVALFSACISPRKACRKADRLLARAVWKCPDILRQDSATVTTRPDSARIQAMPGRTDLDSLLAACNTLNAALMAARSDFPTQPPSTAPVAAVRVRHTPSVHAAVAKMQRAACDWQPFTEHFGRITVEVRNQDGVPLLLLSDPGETKKVPCPPTVNKTVVTGVAEWYRTFFWVLIGFIALALIFGISDIRNHHH
jgi:hypothetical protein